MPASVHSLLLWDIAARGVVNLLPLLVCGILAKYIIIALLREHLVEMRLAIVRVVDARKARQRQRLMAMIAAEAGLVKHRALNGHALSLIHQLVAHFTLDSSATKP